MSPNHRSHPWPSSFAKPPKKIKNYTYIKKNKNSKTNKNKNKNKNPNFVNASSEGKVAILQADLTYFFGDLN